MNIVYLITDSVTNLKYIGSKRNYKGVGNTSGPHSEETKKIISDRTKGQFKDPKKIERHRKGCSKAQSKRWANATEEERRNHSQMIKESHQNMSEEAKSLRKEKLSKSAKRMHQNMTDEQKAAYSEKQRTSQSTAQSVTIDGKTYISLRDASRELGIHKITIARRCKNPKFTNYNFN